MAISFGTNIEMKLIDAADSLSNWAGPHDDLEAYGFAIQGADCVAVAIRKNEALTITVTNTVTSVPAGSQVIAQLASSVAHLADSQSLRIDSASGTSNTYDFTADINGAFQPMAFDCDTGSTSFPENFSNLDYIWDSSGQNVRTSNNIWMDCSYIGNGVDLAGTTASDTLFAEGQSYDETNDTFNGVLIEKEGVIFAQSNIFLSCTSGNSFGETLVFYQTSHGNNTYTLDGTGTVDFQGTNIILSGTATLDIDMSSMTSFDMSGGSITNADSVTFASGQDILGVVFADCTTISTGASNFNNNSVNTVTTINITGDYSSGSITSATTINLSAELTGTSIITSSEIDLTGASSALTNCTIDKSTGTQALTTDALSKVTSCDFISDNTGYAVNLGTITSTQSMTWSSTHSSYAGSDGTTGNEVIRVDINNGVTLTLSNTSGGVTPSVHKTGSGTLVWAADPRTITITDIEPDSEIYVWETPVSPSDSVYASAPDINNDGTSEGDGQYYWEFTAYDGETLIIKVINLAYGEVELPFEVSGNRTFGLQQRTDRVYNDPA